MSDYNTHAATPLSDSFLERKLKEYFGYNTFRAYQKEIIDALLLKNDVLAILPTGAGKSLCYQLPALVLPGTTLVISPLISLMQDQVVSLFKNDIPAAFLNSSLNYQEMQNVLNRLSDYKLLYVAPERLADPQFIERLKQLTLSFFVIDEAHCISQWGHSFRVEYRKLALLKEHFPHCPIIALTATATQDVEKDIQNQLGMKRPTVIKGSFDRPNLTIRAYPKNQPHKQLFSFLERQADRSGIIYASTRKGVESVFEELQSAGYSVGRYHAGLSDKERSESQHAFLHDQTTLMVATVAFGMGIHKPDIRFIVHMDMPKTIEQYYQEIGRAGRDGLPAECMMLFGAQDLILYKKFLEDLDDPQIILQMKNKTDRMYRLCTSANCRRKELLRYFGEQFSLQICGACDNCLDDEEVIEGTEMAQKILSCVYRLRQNVGLKMLVDVLRGSKNQHLIKRGYDQLSTYGLLAHLPEQEVRYYVDSLLFLNFLCSSEGEYPVIKWTPQTRAVIDGQQVVYFKKRTFKADKKEYSDKGGKRDFVTKETVSLHYNEQLFEELRQLRLQIAREEQVPPYVVFSDRALQEMAFYIPQTEEEFSKINGVGPVKWIKYGNKFIQFLAPYANSKKSVKREEIHNPLKRNQSKEETVRLYQQGCTLDQLMEMRQLAKSTLLTHLTEAIQEGMDLDISPLVTPDKQAKIHSVIQEVGFDRLNPIKEKLPEEFTYDEIRLAAAIYCRNLI